MAEILLEGRDCETCGTEVRKGAIFCYHCGESVAPDVAVTTDTARAKDSNARIIANTDADAEKHEITADKSEITAKNSKSEIVKDVSDVQVIEEEVESVIIEEEAEPADRETAILKDAVEESSEKPELKTAAAMRRKPKRIQKKRVEIVWEEPHSPPNVWFLIATVIFAILAIGLWFAARYLG